MGLKIKLLILIRSLPLSFQVVTIFFSFFMLPNLSNYSLTAKNIQAFRNSSETPIKTFIISSIKHKFLMLTFPNWSRFSQFPAVFILFHQVSLFRKLPNCYRSTVFSAAITDQQYQTVWIFVLTFKLWDLNMFLIFAPSFFFRRVSESQSCWKLYNLL